MLRRQCVEGDANVSDGAETLNETVGIGDSKESKSHMNERSHSSSNELY